MWPFDNDDGDTLRVSLMLALVLMYAISVTFYLGVTGVLPGVL